MRTIILLLMVAISFAIADAYACSCSANPDFLMVWMESDGAFQGTVKDVYIDSGPRKVVFDIHQIQKGSYPYGDYIFEDASIIRHSDGKSQGSTCSVNYKIGQTYQVFVYGGSVNQVPGHTGICSTMQISGFDEYSREDKDGQIQHYRQAYNFFTQYGFFSSIIPVSAVAITAGVIAWRRRR